MGEGQPAAHQQASRLQPDVTTQPSSVAGPMDVREPPRDLSRSPSVSAGLSGIEGQPGPRSRSETPLDLSGRASPSIPLRSVTPESELSEVDDDFVAFPKKLGSDRPVGDAGEQPTDVDLEGRGEGASVSRASSQSLPGAAGGVVSLFSL